MCHIGESPQQKQWCLSPFGQSWKVTPFLVVLSLSASHSIHIEQVLSRPAQRTLRDTGQCLIYQWPHLSQKDSCFILIYSGDLCFFLPLGPQHFSRWPVGFTQYPGVLGHGVDLKLKGWELSLVSGQWKKPFPHPLSAPPIAGYILEGRGQALSCLDGKEALEELDFWLIFVCSPFWNWTVSLTESFTAYSWILKT